MTLCSVGGMMGILLGAVITWIVYFARSACPRRFLLWVLIAFVVSCAIGLVFGIIRHGRRRIWIRLRR